MSAITARQAKLLAFLRSYAAENDGASPTYMTMVKHMGVAASSKSTIHRLLVQLEERRMIRRMPHRACAIEVIAASRPAIAGAVVDMVLDRIDRLLPDDERAALVRDVARLIP